MKPENILVQTKENQFAVFGSTFKIADLGISEKYAEDGLESVQGTWLTMAPEVARGEKYGYGADMWSLGCCWWWMLSGRYPSQGPDRVPNEVV